MRNKRVELLRSLQEQHGRVSEEVVKLRSHLDGASKRHRAAVDDVQALEREVQAMKLTMVRAVVCDGKRPSWF